jgi:hypothetical protein
MQTWSDNLGVCHVSIRQLSLRPGEMVASDETKDSRNGDIVLHLEMLEHVEISSP